MIDVLICSAPGTLSSRPTLAPAVLKSSAVAAGFNAVAIDLNNEVNNFIKKSQFKKELENFLLFQEISNLACHEIETLIEFCSDRILSFNPKVLALSLLTQDNQFFTIWLCYHLRFIAPNLKIVIGGSGIKNFIAESSIGYAELLKSRKLIDDYINGDGEYSLVEYLKGNLTYPGINSSSWQQITNLNELSYPNFDDYNFSQYTESGIPICDSRGCVRTCEFCDIIEHWKKYQYRTAENIFAEMLYHIEKHKITKFFFYNSLTNGNMKEFSKLLDYICEYNINAEAKISWDGYFIVRNKDQHPRALWQKIKQSNGTLQLGIESVIEKVRINLGKKFTNEDIDHHLAMAKEFSVPLILLLIVGYPTETKQDFEFTKKWFEDRKHYAKFPVKSVDFSLASILPNTELDRKKKDYNITQGEIPTFWISNTTHVSTQDRLEYYDVLTKLLFKLKFSYDTGDGTTFKATKQETLL